MSTLKSLVLITVDCLRADHVGFLGYRRPTTPFLDSLAADSFVFSNAIAAGSPTYYSFPAIMAARHPLALGRDVIGLAPGETTLATVLEGLGYATAAFLAGNPYLSPQFGYSAGFETFRDFLDAEPEPSGQLTDIRLRSRWNTRLSEACHKLRPVGSLYDELYFQYCLRVASRPAPSMDELRRFPSAQVIVDNAFDWLASLGGRPFLLWLHFMDPHAPYYPSADALDNMGDGSIAAARARYLNSYWNRGDLDASKLMHHRDEIIALYDSGIRGVDTQVARLIRKLQQLRLWNNAVFVLTADHGEEFLDHGGRYHAPNKITEELVRVPLLLRVPGVTNEEPARAPFSLVHLAPTLLEAVDAPVPASFRGRSHWEELKRKKSWQGQAVIECIHGCANPFRPETRLGTRLLAVRESRYKLVLNFSSGSQDLFDLQADPGEVRPLPVDAEKQIRRRLLKMAQEHISDSLKLRDPDDVVAARLRELRLEWANSTIRMCA